jgi:hypothetical protein
MHPDLTIVTDQLLAAQAEIHRLAESVDERTWVTRPAPSSSSWSMSECIGHLTLTTEAFLPAMREQLQRPESRARRAPAKMRRSFLAWMLSRALEPPARQKYPTTTAFVPDEAMSKAETLAEYDRSQDALLAMIRLGDGIDLTRIRLVSPFDPRLHYSFFSALHIAAAHQRRHIAQAIKARDRLAAAR